MAPAAQVGDDGTLHLRGSCTNDHARPQRVAGIVLLDATLTLDGVPAEWFLSTLAHSRRISSLAETLPSANDAERGMWAGFGMPVPSVLPRDEFHEDPRWRRFLDVFTLMSEGGAHGLLVAAAGEPRADLRCDVQLTGTRLRLLLTSVLDVELAPGETRHAQEAVLRCGAHDTLVRAMCAEWAQTHHARITRGPLSGWCSWYHDSSGVTAGRIARIAQLARAEGLPFGTIQVDDGFQRQVGDWALNERFSGGWAPLVSAISAAGALPGIWLAPLAVHESTALFRDHPTWFQRDAEGALLGSASNWGPQSRWLDPTHPEVQAWIRALLHEVVALGFSYVKIDFNTVQDGARLHDPTQTRFQALRGLYRLYREALGENVYLLACIGFNRAVVGHADAARIGPDSCAQWRAAHPCCITDCIRATGSSALANRVLFANDPDVTYTKPRHTLTVDEWRTWHGFVGLLGGAQLVSEPFDEADCVMGRVALAPQADGLHVTAEVYDPHPVAGVQPYQGTCVEIFAEIDGQRRNWYFTPDRLDLPATATRTARGWQVCTVVPSAARYEIKLDADPQGRGRSPVMRFGSGAPWESTDGYQAVTTASDQEVVRPGWRDTTELYRLVVPPAPETAIPRHGGSDPDHAQIGFTAVRPWGRFAVVQRYNPAAVPADLLVEHPGLGPCHVWSFWDRRDLGVSDGDVRLPQQAAHASTVLRFTPVDRSQPLIVGSTLHLAQGAAELAEVVRIPGGLRLALADAGTRDGALWFAWSGTLTIGTVSGCTATLQRDGALWRLDLRGRCGTQQLVLNASEA